MLAVPAGCPAEDLSFLGTAVPAWPNALSFRLFVVGYREVQ